MKDPDEPMRAPGIDGPLFSGGNGTPPVESRADQIFAAFRRFHKKNPGVWRAFREYADLLRAGGREHYSSRTIVAVLRFNSDLKTTDADCKINNNFSVYYGRMYLAVTPEAGEFFKLRHRISTEKEAYDTDVEFFDPGEPGDETRLTEQLRRLADA